MVETDLPNVVESESQLDALLARPNDALIDFMRTLEGDIMILGIAGKMGVSLGHLAVEAIRAAGLQKSVYGVARFSNVDSREKLESVGVKTIQCDLMDRRAVDLLPQVPNVLYMAGRKFGTEGDKSLTWAMNTLMPANVAEHYRSSRIVAFSTGCVYPLTSIDCAPNEAVEPAPIGEYAQSCLGRERAFEYFCNRYGTPLCLYRLNYAIDLRYGVLYDIAERIWNDEPVNNSVGYFNAIWQGDANHAALMCLGQCTSPATVLNVTRPEVLNTEAVAHQIGELMGKPVRFSTTAGELCYLSDATRAIELFGEPSVGADRLIRWQAHWVKSGGRALGKPTHFEVTDGTY